MKGGPRNNMIIKKPSTSKGESILEGKEWLLKPEEFGIKDKKSEFGIKKKGKK